MPASRRSLFRAIMVAVTVATSALAPAQSPDRAMRIYDCGALVEALPDQPGPDLRRFVPGAETEDLPERRVSSYIEPDRLVDLIRGNIRPDSWQHQKNAIQFRDGLLVVVQTPDVLDEIAELLRALRDRVRRRLHLVGRVLSVRLDHLGVGRPGGERFSGAVLGPDDVRHLLDVPFDDDRVRRLGTFSLPAPIGQLVHAGSVAGTRFIRALDASTAENAAAVEPILDRMLTGIVLSFRAFPAGASLVVLDSEVARAAPCGDLKTIETGAGRVDVPIRSLEASATTLLVPRGDAAMLAVSDATDAGRAIVFLVEPRILDPGAADRGGKATPPGQAPARPVPAVARPIRIYDVRFLVSPYPSRPCGYLSDTDPGVAWGEEDEGGSIFGAPAEDAGVVYNPEDLVELIRTSIAEDTWANTRNAIDLSDGLMLVVQKPEVHARIEKLLSDLEARRGVLVTTRVSALAMPDDTARALFPDPAALGEPLDAATLARVSEAVTGGEAIVLGHALLTGFNRQRSHIVSLIERSVIKWAAPELAKGAVLTTPVMRALRTGFILDVTPTLAGDTRHVSLDLLARFCTANEPRAVPFGPDESLVVHRFRTETADLRTTAILPDGATLAFLRGAAPGRPGHRIAFLVGARSTPLTGRE